jgi:hypothetical protein
LFQSPIRLKRSSHTVAEPIVHRVWIVPAAAGNVSTPTKGSFSVARSGSPETTGRLRRT